MTWRIWNPSALLEECKMAEWLWKTFGSCSKIKSRISIWSSNFTSGYVLKPYWGFLDSSVGKKIHLLCRRPQLDSWIGKILWGRDSYPVQYSWAYLMAQLVKKPSAMQETWVQSLGWENILEKGKATTPVVWPGESLGLYSLWSGKESDTTEQLSLCSQMAWKQNLEEIFIHAWSYNS